MEDFQRRIGKILSRSYCQNHKQEGIKILAIQGKLVRNWHHQSNIMK
jgi:hypothetical protein